MTDTEAARLIYLVTCSYPAHYRHLSEQSVAEMLKIWTAVLREYSLSQAEQGLYIYVSCDTKGFPPVPGQIIDCIKKAEPRERAMDALEAWALVYKAICNSGYDWESEFSKLPPLCKRAVSRAENLREWALMPSDTVQSVGQSHFIRIYETVVRRESEYQRMPIEVRNRIAAMFPEPERIAAAEPETERGTDEPIGRAGWSDERSADIERLRAELGMGGAS